MPRQSNSNPFYKILKVNHHRFNPKEIIREFKKVNEDRVDVLAKTLSDYISTNLPAAFEKRDGLSDYRTNPYVLMTSASVMNLGDPSAFANFLFNSKLYMALETSFGKSVEAAFVGQYPLNQDHKWIEAPEKVAEFAALKDLSREEKAKQRTKSVWREIDKSCVVGTRRYITSIKSGPNTINDTQVEAMYRAIADKNLHWMKETKRTYKNIKSLDIVLGLTYGTDRTTNNKENQILVKLLENGFVEEDRTNKPGILIDEATASIRVYRRIGKDFWAFIGRPDSPSQASFIYLEILLSLAKALSTGMEIANLEARINSKIQHLSQALAKIRFPRNSLPAWIEKDFTDDQLFWFATAMSAFFDEGI